MKVNSNSLIVKMIQKSFWFMGADSELNKPSTSCGLFFKGVLSGVWHVFYLTSMLLFSAGVLFSIAALFGASLDLQTYPAPIVIIFLTGLVTGMFFIFVILPLYTIMFLYDKFLKGKVSPLKYKLVFRVTFGVGVIWNKVHSWVSKFCKSIDYE